ncbi:BBP7 family outer membrane beta-barrel protein [Mariniblastus fucicola]|uniref:Uncharacterized protein n=1 Tax=Mariniblastus fucicola TaxID=980251 RepID=A0A5B9P6E1_9BACT|nr:BBP7 family outer membrane beta-barrel protein [Mariniblastus fucicola]QEG21099.1 hypothetical protein MFFC18_09510 [Mariniblastus fucicola]
MKLKIQTTITGIAHGSIQLAAAGIAGLSLLTTAAMAQDATTGFTPGSIPSQPFSLLEEPTSSTNAWVPPVTDVQTSPQWSPPQTPDQKSPSDSIDEVLEQANRRKNNTNSPSSLILESAESVIESRPSDSAKTTVPPLESPSNSLETPSLLPLPCDVPSIPLAPEFCEDEPFELDCVDAPIAYNDGVAPLDQSFEFSNGSSRSIIDDSPETLPLLDAGEPVQPTLPQRIARPAIVENGAPELITPVRNILGGVNSRLSTGDPSVHAVGQLTFLSLGRDYRGKGRLLSNGGPNLLANGPDEGDFTGVDINYGRRRSGGRGWEMRYIGFDPGSTTDVTSGDPTLAWGGLTPPLNDPTTWGGTIPQGIPETYGLSGIGTANFTMADVFDDASNHRVSRDSEFGSFEFNFLRASAGGTRLSCGNSMVEFFGGLRGVAFNETTVFTAAGTQSGLFPRSAFYSSEVKNSLFGLQIGGRLERQLQRGWGYTFGSRVGIYNNRVESRQRAEFQFDDGSTTTAQVLYGDDASREFDLSGKDNELAFLGELDFGVVYQFRPRTRARFGYRGIVVTNVADAAGQLEDSLFDIDLVAEPKAFSDFIVGGLYFGVDHAF